MQQEMALVGMQEPICIIAKGDALCVAASAMLAAVLNEQDKKFCVRAVQQYNGEELDAIMCDEYPTFILLDCNEQKYKEKLASKNAFFVDAIESYKLAKSFSDNARKFAYLIVAGRVARYLECGGSLDVDDEVLTDALQAGKLVTHYFDFAELDEKLLSSLVVKNGSVVRKLFDFANMLNACVRNGKGAVFIASVLGDSKANDAVQQVWSEFRADIENAFNWYERNKAKCAISGNGCLIVNMQEYLSPNLAGSLAARIIRKGELEEGTFVMVLVYVPDNKIRVSLRIVGYDEKKDLVGLLADVFKELKGEFGGNKLAAGGVFSRSDEQRFLLEAQKVLETAFVEEMVE